MYRSRCTRQSRLHLASRNEERGFTLLLAALVASIVLSIGTAIFSIAQKQVALSSLGRDSQYAFYAADTGAECALYWDAHFTTPFFTSTQDSSYFATSSPGVPTWVPVQCNGQNIHAWGNLTTQPPTNSYVSSYPYDVQFELEVTFGGGPRCVQVTVNKVQTGGGVGTTVTSDGYNVPCAGLLTNTRAIQRTIQLKDY